MITKSMNYNSVLKEIKKYNHHNNFYKNFQIQTYGPKIFYCHFFVIFKFVNIKFHSKYLFILLTNEVKIVFK